MTDAEALERQIEKHGPIDVDGPRRDVTLRGGPADGRAVPSVREDSPRISVPFEADEAGPNRFAVYERTGPGEFGFVRMRNVV